MRVLEKIQELQQLASSRQVRSNRGLADLVSICKELELFIQTWSPRALGLEWEAEFEKNSAIFQKLATIEGHINSRY